MTIALIGASAALSATLLKEKDSRVKDAIDFAKSSPEDFKSPLHYTTLSFEMILMPTLLVSMTTNSIIYC